MYKIFTLNKRASITYETESSLKVWNNTEVCLTVIRCILFLKVSCEATLVSRSPSSKGHLMSTLRVLIVANYFHKRQKELNSKLLRQLGVQLGKYRLYFYEG